MASDTCEEPDKLVNLDGCGVSRLKAEAFEASIPGIWTLTFSFQPAVCWSTRP